MWKILISMDHNQDLVIILMYDTIFHLCPSSDYLHITYSESKSPILVLVVQYYLLNKLSLGIYTIPQPLPSQLKFEKCDLFSYQFFTSIRNVRFY